MRRRGGQGGRGGGGGDEGEGEGEGECSEPWGGKHQITSATGGNRGRVGVGIKASAATAIAGDGEVGRRGWGLVMVCLLSTLPLANGIQCARCGGSEESWAVGCA